MSAVDPYWCDSCQTRGCGHVPDLPTIHAIKRVPSTAGPVTECDEEVLPSVVCTGWGRRPGSPVVGVTCGGCNEAMGVAAQTGRGTWPGRNSPYACSPCRTGDHAKCEPTVQWGMTDSGPCGCLGQAPATHADHQGMVARVLLAGLVGDVRLTQLSPDELAPFENALRRARFAGFDTKGI